MSNNKIIIPLIFLLTFSFSATIQGIIKDKRSGQPLIGANVMLEGTSLGSSTDENGFYIINEIDRGKYKLMVSYIGYEEIIENISVNSKSSMNLNLSSCPTMSALSFDCAKYSNRPMLEP